MIAEIHGQWIGETREEGAEPTLSVVNIEKRTAGSAQLFGINEQFKLRTLSYGSYQQQSLQITGTSRNPRVMSEDNIWIPLQEFWAQNNYPGKAPTSTQYKAQLSEDGVEICGTFESDVGGKGTFKLYRATTLPPRPPDHSCLTWQQFKTLLGTFRGKRAIYFRGQRDSNYKLRTLFHRAERNDMLRYFSEEIPALCMAVNAYSKHLYHPERESDLWALLGLAQHHGFPTPMLDWTRSPYIASFFAFNVYDCVGKCQEPKAEDAVTISIFDGERWAAHNPPRSISDPWPQLRFLELPAHNNPRYLPQQAIASFSNLDDIELFVRWMEREQGQKYLTTVTILYSEFAEVLEDLQLMGITAASLFPGFDGVCRSLAASRFH